MHGALHRILGLLVALPLAGCDALGVDSFAGSVIAMDLTWPLTSVMTTASGAKVTVPTLLMPGEHLELWAIDASNHPARILPERPSNAANPFPGFTVNLVVDPSEPCLIDTLLDPQTGNASPTLAPQSGEGYLVLSQSGQSGASPALAEQQVIDHVRQVLDLTVTIPPAGMQSGAYLTGGATSDLLVLSEAYAGPATAPQRNTTLTALALDDPSTHSARKAGCSAFFSSLINDQCPSEGCRPTDTTYSYYIGNPRQYTAPLLGRLYGFFDFQTSPATDPSLPQQDYGGITITTLADLSDATALVLSIETSAAPAAPTQALVQGVRLPAADSGRGAARFELVVGMQPVGTVSILSGLNQGLSP